MPAPTKVFSRTDTVGGLAIATVITLFFIAASPGMALIGTFVPGVLFTAIAFLWVARRGLPESAWSKIAPWYFTGLLVQMAHFAEEYFTGFPIKFPVAYGGSPFTSATFVSFNLVAYTIFAVALRASLLHDKRPLLVPALFFVVYGTWGNFVSHATWCILSGGYFPGALTAGVYVLLGPKLLYLFVQDVRGVFSFLALFTVALVACALTLFHP